MCANLFELSIRIGCQRRAAILDSLVAQLGKLIGIQEVGQVSGFLQVELSAIVQVQLLLAACPLGLHKDDTIGSTGTIDSCSCSVLQYGDTLDIIGVKVAQSHLTIAGVCTKTGHTVDNQQWVAVDTTYMEVCLTSRTGVAC